MAKERNKLITYLNDFFKLKVGIERLFYFALILFLVCHITACMWYLCAKLEDLNQETWYYSRFFY